MSERKVTEFIKKLEIIEENHQATSRRLKTTSKVVFGAAVGVVGIDLLASGSVAQAAEAGLFIGVPGLGIRAAGLVFEKVAEKAGNKSERLRDRLSDRPLFRRSRLVLLK